MKAFHLVGPAPFYTNSFLLISDAGNAVVIDPAAEVQEYDKILKEHGGRLSLILCTHGHYDHVGSAGVLSREWGAKLYCEPADCRGTQLLPLKGSDSGYEEGEVIPLDELSFTVWHTPGHTEGSVVLLCENYLFVGDTVFQGSIGRTDLEGGDSRKMDESLRKFAALPVPAEVLAPSEVLDGEGVLDAGWDGYVRVVKPLINLLAASYAKGGYDAGCALECFRAAAAEIKGGASAEDACALMRRYLPELAEDCQLEAEIARATEGLR